uniref:Uncharacterized protein n=1 Tax=Pseudo-nitzschia delicatissima TaxID=44447 RepID=A0A7S0ULX3_9STRA|mmetsp:Transcript_4743/g.9843  ORF Transcript_4743/g.9843 Transcript_4743/m.9843 type:complete len:201 (+) Transcript_4743:115-717(+)
MTTMDFTPFSPIKTKRKFSSPIPFTIDLPFPCELFGLPKLYEEEEEKEETNEDDHITRALAISSDICNSSNSTKMGSEFLSFEDLSHRSFSPIRIPRALSFQTQETVSESDSENNISSADYKQVRFADEVGLSIHTTVYFESPIQSVMHHECEEDDHSVTLEDLLATSPSPYSNKVYGENELTALRGSSGLLFLNIFDEP